MGPPFKRDPGVALKRFLNNNRKVAVMDFMELMDLLSIPFTLWCYFFLIMAFGGKIVWEITKKASIKAKHVGDAVVISRRAFLRSACVASAASAVPLQSVATVMTLANVGLTAAASMSVHSSDVREAFLSALNNNDNQ